jgi:hypothetical protein
VPISRTGETAVASSLGLARLSCGAIEFSGASDVPRDRVTKLWKRARSRGSERAGITWDQMQKIAAEWLPRPSILYPGPLDSFSGNHPR